MSDEAQVPVGVRKYMSAIGRKGGLVSSERKGAAGWTPEQRSENGKKGAAARAKKKRKRLTAKAA